MVKTEMRNLFLKQSYSQNTYIFCLCGELEYVRTNQCDCTIQWCIDTNLEVDPYQCEHGWCYGNAQTQHEPTFDLQTRAIIDHDVGWVPLKLMCSDSVDIGTIVLEIIKCGANLVSEFFSIFKPNYLQKIPAAYSLDSIELSHMLSVFKSAKHSRSIVACRYAFTPWARTL